MKQVGSDSARGVANRSIQGCSSVHRSRILLVFAFICAAFCGVCILAGCGTTESNGTFQHKEPIDISGFQKVQEKAEEYVSNNPEEEMSEDSESSLNQNLAERFNAANALYREGDYKGAQAGYEEILDEYAYHFGSNVNLTMTLLQQEKNQDALYQALVTYYKFPSEQRTILNVQASAAACGYSVYSVGNTLFGSFEVNKTYNITDLYDYNIYWDKVECILDKVDDSNRTDMNEEYSTLIYNIKNLDKSEVGDDMQYLLNYLYASAYQVGLISAEELQSNLDYSSLES